MSGHAASDELSGGGQHRHGPYHACTYVGEGESVDARAARRARDHRGEHRGSFVAIPKSLVAEFNRQVVAFSIADRQSGSIFALFVLPEYEGKGIGSRLLNTAVEWLWQKRRSAYLADNCTTHSRSSILCARSVGTAEFARFLRQRISRRQGASLAREGKNIWRLRMPFYSAAARLRYRTAKVTRRPNHEHRAPPEWQNRSETRRDLRGHPSFPRKPLTHSPFPSLQTSAAYSRPSPSQS